MILTRRTNTHLDTYKAKVYPGRLMDAVLSVARPLSFSVVFFVIIACVLQEWAGALFLVIPVLVYIVNRLLRRRLDIHISTEGVEIHYLPQLFIQKGKVIDLPFSEVADCHIAQLRFGKYRNTFLIIALKNGKRYSVLSWLPPFQDVTTYAANCEEAICAAFERYKENRPTY